MKKTIIVKMGDPLPVYSHWKLQILHQKYRINGGKVTERLLVDSDVKPIMILAITKDGEIILTKQYRFAAGKEIIEVPGGIVEGGCSYKNTAKRELEEETGYTSNNIFRIGVDIFFDPSLITFPYSVYVALDCYKTDIGERDYDEIISKVILLSPSKLFAMVDNGNINDSKTLAIILLGRKYIEKCSNKRIF